MDIINNELYISANDTFNGMKREMQRTKVDSYPPIYDFDLVTNEVLQNQNG